MALACYAHEPHIYEEIVIRRILSLNSPSLLDALQSPYLHDACHFVMLIEPSPTSHSESTKKFASRRIAEMFWDERSKIMFMSQNKDYSKDRGNHHTFLPH
jgi:hypothetical protein